MSSKQPLPGFDVDREELDRLVAGALIEDDASRRIGAMTVEEKAKLGVPVILDDQPEEGVTKKQAEDMLKKLHKSAYRIPDSLKVGPNSADAGDSNPD